MHRRKTAEKRCSTVAPRALCGGWLALSPAAVTPCRSASSGATEPSRTTVTPAAAVQSSSSPSLLHKIVTHAGQLNYFGVFGLPLTPAVDVPGMHQYYLSLQNAAHPDRAAGRSAAAAAPKEAPPQADDDADGVAALASSTTGVTLSTLRADSSYVNEAYGTLKSAYPRCRYIYQTLLHLPTASVAITSGLVLAERQGDPSHKATAPAAAAVTSPTSAAPNRPPVRRLNMASSPSKQPNFLMLIREWSDELLTIEDGLPTAEMSDRWKALYEMVKKAADDCESDALAAFHSGVLLSSAQPSSSEQPSLSTPVHGAAIGEEGGGPSTSAVPLDEVERCFRDFLDVVDCWSYFHRMLTQLHDKK